MKNKTFYYIVTCADDDRASQKRTLECFRGYADCVEGAKEMGVVYGTGVYRGVSTWKIRKVRRKHYEKTNSRQRSPR